MGGVESQVIITSLGASNRLLADPLSAAAAAAAADRWIVFVLLLLLLRLLLLLAHCGVNAKGQSFRNRIRPALRHPLRENAID